MIEWHQRHTWLVFSASEVDRCRAAEYFLHVHAYKTHTPPPPQRLGMRLTYIQYIYGSIYTCMAPCTPRQTYSRLLKALVLYINEDIQYIVHVHVVERGSNCDGPPTPPTVVRLQ